MKAYWFPAEYNVGDTLTPHILRHFLPGVEIERASDKEEGKILAVGSIMRKVKRGDVVWGTGAIRGNETYKEAKAAKILAVRGQLTRSLLMQSGAVVPEIYGDPALLLPLMYQPKIEKKFKVGFIPHYADKAFAFKQFRESGEYDKDTTMIDVGLNWREFVDRVLECGHIVSSSLHGIIIAEAYGIPASWIEYSDKVIGNGFKFRDYLTGTGRKPRGTGAFPPIEKLGDIQRGLIEALTYLKNEK